MEPRIRFAPSPTGFVHLGSLRMALFDYLLARSLGGKLILRIEDTDQKRLVEGAVEGLIDTLNWVGLKFDEGPHVGGDYGPYIQSQRQHIYDKYKKIALEAGFVYPCFCSSERLEEMRSEQMANKMPPRYDRRCRNISKEEVKSRIDAGEPYVIRHKMPMEGDIIAFDELRGEIRVKATDIDDYVLIKSDGTPTYQFANIVDDHEMRITHALRGEEWIPSFPKNVQLYRDFGWEAPKFIHMALTLNKTGGKLSKRQGDVSVEDYRDKGYLQEALLNFNALLGWHPKDDNEILSLKELEEKFNYKDMGVKGAVFDLDKLDYLNGYYIRQMHTEKLLELCRPYLEENIGLTGKEYKKQDEFLKCVVGMEQERLKKLADIGEATRFLFLDELEYDKEILLWKKMDFALAAKNLAEMASCIEKIPAEAWTNNSIEEAVMSHIKATEGKIGEYLWPLRVALSGQKASPSPFDIAEALSKEDCLGRIEHAIAKLNS